MICDCRAAINRWRKRHRRFDLLTAGQFHIVRVTPIAMVGHVETGRLYGAHRARSSQRSNINDVFQLHSLAVVERTMGGYGCLSVGLVCRFALGGPEGEWKRVSRC